ncbi:hypothetical protein [Streptomyces naphthomycinicus]|uniref:hypothetical protein n=1 Tax=Streptomyces naphthomycinicus TaxID=2872625 RepID=UPI001CECF285|nr:hypothetical protein [Streptomyces sp. TML10]
MTRHPDHGPDDQAAEHWFDQHDETLTNELDDVLDVEAGLHEILLCSRHDTAVDDLDTILDTEAGLAAILPTTPDHPQASSPGVLGATDGQTSPEAFLRSVSPTDRLGLRNHPHVKKASRALEHASGRFRERGLWRSRTHARASVVRLARDLAQALKADLQRLALALDEELGRHDSASVLIGLFDLSHALLRGLDGPRRRWYAFTGAKEDAVALSLGLEGVLALGHTPDLERARARAADLVHVLDLETDLALASDPALGQAVGRTYRVLDDIRTSELRRAIGLVLRQEPPMFDKYSVRAFLDDFTAADLRAADLANADLGGILWSQYTTQWPATVDVENLKACSQETPPGSGTWVVRPGTTTIPDFADLG